MAAFTRGDMQLSGSGEPVRLNGFGITSGYFRVLGLQPELGREFDRKAEIPGNGLQVILSDRLWRTQFGADPDIIGRKITLERAAIHRDGRDAGGHGASRQRISRGRLWRGCGYVVAVFV